MWYKAVAVLRAPLIAIGAYTGATTYIDYKVEQLTPSWARGWKLPDFSGSKEPTVNSANDTPANPTANDSMTISAPIDVSGPLEESIVTDKVTEGEIKTALEQGSSKVLEVVKSNASTILNSGLATASGVKDWVSGLSAPTTKTTKSEGSLWETIKAKLPKTDENPKYAYDISHLSQRLKNALDFSKKEELTFTDRLKQNFPFSKPPQKEYRPPHEQYGLYASVVGGATLLGRAYYKTMFMRKSSMLAKKIKFTGVLGGLGIPAAYLAFINAIDKVK